jgi:1,2-phenylacetyl-CoA epoxidase PaaB subunit
MNQPMRRHRICNGAWFDLRRDRDTVKDKHLGAVEAPDEKAAIAEAMQTFNTTPARRPKIVVSLISPSKRD